jgi:hypothetical protein
LPRAQTFDYGKALAFILSCRADQREGIHT